MYMDPELITRTCHWRGEDQRVVDAWPEIIERLDMDDAMRRQVAAALRRFGDEQVPRLPGLLREYDADDAVVQDCLRTIEAQARTLQEITHDAQATRSD